MPPYPTQRVRIQPETFAITAVAHDRRRIFQRTANPDLIMKTLSCYCKQGRFKPDGFVIMPDHIHVLITPSKRYTLLVPRLNTSRRTDALAFLQGVQLRVFGADVHGFRLNPPLPEADVMAFENVHNVSLPHDFRQFLTDVGNGGAGPFYGVFPLGKIDDNFGLQPWQEDDGFVGVLSEPFPLGGEWNDISSQPSAELADLDESEYDRQMDTFQTTYWRASLVNGAIPICHEGCALRIWLVVTGTQAGYLWEDRRSEYGGFKPLRLADGSPATFTGWYDAWLNDCLNSKKNDQ